MGNFGGYYKGEKKKFSKEKLEKKANKNKDDSLAFKLPELIRKKKDN